MLSDSHALVIAQPCSTRWQIRINTRSVKRLACPRGLPRGLYAGRITSNSTLFASSAVWFCGSSACVSAIWKWEFIKQIERKPQIPDFPDFPDLTFPSRAVLWFPAFPTVLTYFIVRTGRKADKTWSPED